MLSKNVFELDSSDKITRTSCVTISPYFFISEMGLIHCLWSRKETLYGRGSTLSCCSVFPSFALSPFVKETRRAFMAPQTPWPFSWLPGRWSMSADHAMPQPGPGRERAEPFFLLKSLHSYGLRLSLTLSSFLQALPLWFIRICLAAFHTFCVLHQKVQTVSNELVLEFTRQRRTLSRVFFPSFLVILSLHI